MSYFTLSNALGNPASSNDTDGAARKPKASFADFLNQSGTGQDSNDNSSIQSSPEKKQELNDSQAKPEFSLYSSFQEKEHEEVAKPEELKKEEKRESIKEEKKPEEKRESIQKDNKRESLPKENKRESIKTDNKKESLKFDSKRESIKEENKINAEPAKKQSLKNDNEPPQKRETIKKAGPPEVPIEEKRESIKNPPEEKRESIAKPVEEQKQVSLTADNSTLPTQGVSEDMIAHPPVPKSPMHRSGIPLLKHAYTIVEHKVDFPVTRENPYVPKYYDDTDVKTKEKPEESNEGWNPVRKNFQVNFFFFFKLKFSFLYGFFNKFIVYRDPELWS